MTEKTQGLTRRAREFVALGASVGAGCHPCVTFHVKAGTEAGIDSTGLLAAIAAAQQVAADAAVRMARHAGQQVSTTVNAAIDHTASEATLAALGAALAANSIPNIERYLAEATGLGVSRRELADALSVAHEVQANAARIHTTQATALLKNLSQPAEPAEPATGECDQSCPCHGQDDRLTDETGPASSQGSSGSQDTGSMLAGCCGTASV